MTKEARQGLSDETLRGALRGSVQLAFTDVIETESHATKADGHRCGPLRGRRRTPAIPGRRVGPGPLPPAAPTMVEADGEDFTLPAWLLLDDLALCSVPARDRLLAAGVVNVQFFPAAVRRSQSGAVIQAYVANVVGRIAWIDQERSRILRQRSRPLKVEALAFTPGRLTDIPIFVPHELPEIIVVRPRAEQALRGLPGIRCIPVESWSLPRNRRAT